MVNYRDLQNHGISETKHALDVLDLIMLLFILAGVGKSCLLLRFSDGSFTTSFITTIG
jgi:GTPase SAR1 family protein